MSYTTSNCYGKSNITPLECYAGLYKVYDYLKSGDTLAAINTYENLDKVCDPQIQSFWHYRMFKIYQNLDPRKAEVELMKASSKGYLFGYFSTKDVLKEISSLRDVLSDSLILAVIDNHLSALDSMSNESKTIRKRISKIHKADQALRNDKEYNKCKKHFYQIKKKLINKDTVKDHNELMLCGLEYRRKDSIVMQEFVDLIFELGHVPNGNEIMDQSSTILVIHTPYYNFKENLDSIYRVSVNKGTLSPKAYAFYKGYNETFYNKPFSYYYSHGKDRIEELNLSLKEIDDINKKRRLISLPDFPATAWTHSWW